MSAASTTSVAGQPVSTVALYATLVLFFTNLVGYLDRSVMTLVVGPIKASLHLSDGEIGLMVGLGFVLTFCIAGMFIGRLIDTHSRRNLLLVCVGIWSVCTAAGGFAQTGTQLFAARMGVGIGEAALIPCAVSLISDYFDTTRRGKAYGFFTTGVYAGSGLSLVIVAVALPWVTEWSARLAAQGTVVEPWRIVFASMMIPGLITCGLLATLKEPERNLAPTGGRMTWQGVRDWTANARVFVPHHIALALATLILFAVGAWLPTVLIREHGMPARTTGLLYGAVVTVVGVLGAYLGGVFTDRGSKRAGTRGRIEVAAGCATLGLIGCLLIWAVPQSVPLIVGGALITAGMGSLLVTGIMAMADISPAQSRGQITAIYFVFTGVLGQATGPAIVGYANDLFGGKGGVTLGSILGITGTIAAVGTLLFLWLTVVRLPNHAAVAGRQGAAVPAVTPAVDA